MQAAIPEEYAGYWRSGGTGMIGFYLSDLQRFGGKLPLARRTQYVNVIAPPPRPTSPHQVRT